MSKNLRKKNPPVASCDDDEAETQDLPTPRYVVSVTDATAGEIAAPEVGGAVAVPPPLRVDDGWKRVEEQLDSLRGVLFQLVSLVTASTVVWRPLESSPGSGDRGFKAANPMDSLAEVMSAIAHAEGTSAIARAESLTQRDAAILDSAAKGWLSRGPGGHVGSQGASRGFSKEGVTGVEPGHSEAYISSLISMFGAVRVKYGRGIVRASQESSHQSADQPGALLAESP
ncbi:unnamed protein product [Lampetra fluviatilis]